MNRHLAYLGLVAAAIASWPAWAEVTNGAAAKVPSYEARGATEVATVGKIAPALQGKPLIVRIHADWCPACKATQPTIDALKQSYAGKVNFIQFDVTNGKTAVASENQARVFGLEQFYDAAKGATSTVAVIDPKDGKVYATFYNDSTFDDYKRAVEDALRSESE